MTRNKLAPAAQVVEMNSPEQSYIVKQCIAVHAGKTLVPEVREIVTELYESHGFKLGVPVIFVRSPYALAIAGVVMTKYFLHKNAGNDLEAYELVQKIFEEEMDDDAPSWATIQQVRAIVKKFLSLPDTAEGLVRGGKSVNTDIDWDDHLLKDLGVSYLVMLHGVLAGDIPKESLAKHLTPHEWTVAHDTWLHEKFVLVNALPEYTKVDGMKRRHCTDGPYAAWADGYKMYAIEGHNMTEQAVLYPESLTAAQIAAEKDEMVRCIMEERKSGRVY